ncbi:uncharacterized protein LOC110442463 [Mizuhopecten yessoensis]|uniref:Uncharacterized protein n=1 Tax=Mizuhopecten yessoensis TaxID=6573 RepID=A0A210PH81_MIZYE|nr:uncharacterized protein LOC110442463 [Mizuhopecten yessoensis]OWF35827.1 hypothetical protein KP79_PYT04093 [Mizuhopecten yessoensis]
MCTGEIYFDVGVPNQWKPPCRSDQVWSGPGDKKVREFYDKHVDIKKSTFHHNQVEVSRLLKSLYKELKTLEKSHQFLRFRPFVKQGGSRERLKVGEANEFDAVLPFTFLGTTATVKESPSNGLPSGHGEIEINKVNSRMTVQPKNLFSERDGKRYVNSRVFHDQFIKGRIDAALQKLNARPEFAGFNIKRQATAPAIKLDAKVNGEQISIDVVPGYDIREKGSTLRKFMVSRWIPGSQNDNRVEPIPDPNTAWRISHSQFEMRILDRWISTNLTAQRLVRGARILKAVREHDVERNSSSQLHHVLSSYHIKNVLLHSILHLRKIDDVGLPNVTSACKHLVHMIDTSLEHRNLPQFFSNNPSLEEYFPIYNFHTDYPMVNLFQERSNGDLQQIRADLEKALDHFNLKPLLDDVVDIHEDKLEPFLSKVKAGGPSIQP